MKGGLSLPLLISGLCLLELAFAQTRPRPEQVDPDQVRIGPSDKRPGTLINVNDIQKDRHVVPLRTLEYMYGVKLDPPTREQIYLWPPTADPETKVICEKTIFRVDREGVWGGAAAARWADVCWTELGQKLLLEDPSWMAWYSKQ
jgi:hypothetical protein